MTRAQRLFDTLSAIADWRGARGAARLRARRNAMAMLVEWRMLVVAPERAAFERRCSDRSNGGGWRA